MRIYSFSPFGYEGALVTVEVDLRRGIPAVDIVGLADGAIKESRERMASAIRNCGFDFPSERVLISLSPADLKKEGAGFDLAVALSVLEAKARMDEETTISKDSQGLLVLGELELSGRVRAVRAVHAAVSSAKERGITRCIVPKENEEEAKDVRGMEICAVQNLNEAFDALTAPDAFKKNDGEKSEEDKNLPEGSVLINGVYFPPQDEDFCFSTIKGERPLVRALEIAAAGQHNLLAFGPPGCGKTLALQRFPNLLPLLSYAQAQSTTRIHSIAGLIAPGCPAIRKRPFRQPHQSASIEGMCGGGVHCAPGEISLAHNGVLFLDEAPEFKSAVLQMLRVPLESRSVTLCRAGRSTTFPASFELLMAANPCPCGFYGAKDKVCLCSARSIEQYWKKLSGPLMDRIDIRVKVDKSGDQNAPTTEELRKHIAVAVKVQEERQHKCNAQLTPHEIKQFCVCTDEAWDYLYEQETRLSMSQRAVASCLKLSRTIADFAEREYISKIDMIEAVEFRRTEGGVTLNF